MEILKQIIDFHAGIILTKLKLKESESTENYDNFKHC